MSTKFVTLVMFAALTLTSCVSKKKYLELTDQKTAVEQSLAQAQNQISTLEDEKAALDAECKTSISDLNTKVTGLENDLSVARGEVTEFEVTIKNKDGEIQTIKDQIRQAFATAKSSGLNIETRNGRLYVRTARPIQYKSGSARLSKEDKQLLEDLANTLKAAPGLELLVEGHTDNAQMVQGAAYNDNWDLGYSRAKRVLDRLVKAEVNPAQLSVVSRSEFMPKVSANPDSKETRAENRRIEFIVVADAADLYNMNL
ncbi:MAG: OmpA family protein [Saprospiraceae bacterium]